MMVRRKVSGELRKAVSDALNQFIYLYKLMNDLEKGSVSVPHGVENVMTTWGMMPLYASEEEEDLEIEIDSEEAALAIEKWFEENGGKI